MLRHFFVVVILKTMLNFFENLWMLVKFVVKMPLIFVKKINQKLFKEFMVSDILGNHESVYVLRNKNKNKQK